jgi:hypothetical protein
MHIVTTRKRRKKKSFRVLTLLTERDDALIIHAQVDDKRWHTLSFHVIDTFCFVLLALCIKAKDIVFKFIIEYSSLIRDFGPY